MALPTSWSSVAKKSIAGRVISAARRAREGERIGELAAHERREVIHRGDRVNVDGVHVVRVVVNPPDHRGKLGDHGQEQAEIVQLAQHRCQRAGASLARS
jgi:predicted metalloprotease